MPDSTVVMVLGRITILLVLAFAAATLLRRSSAGARYLVWLATLVGVVLLPAAAVWAPVRVAVLPAAVAPSHAIRRMPAVANVSTETVAEPTVAPAVAPAAHAAPARPSPFWILGGLWLGAMLALAARLIHGMITVRRIARRARPLETPEWRAALLEVSDRLGLEEPPRLVLSDDVTVPFACGLRRPTVVLPAPAAAWTDDRRRAVLLHELAHVGRGDMMGHLLSRIACVVYWFHPLVWTAARRLRAESELACDDLALQSGARASDYAQHLLDIVTGMRGPATPAAAVAMARRREFEGRLLAILDPARARATPSRMRAAALVVGLAAVYGAVGLVVLGPRSAAAVTPQSVAMTATPATPARPTAASPASPPPSPAAAAPRPARVASPARPTPAPVASAPEQPSSDSSGRRVTLLATILRTDSSAELRKVAAWGLEQFAESDAARDALAKALRGDASATVREMAAWALESASGEPGTSALINAMTNDHDRSVRSTAAWALAHESSPAVVPLYVAALRDSSAEVRATAAWAMGQSDLEHAPPGLIAAIADKDRHVRLVTVWALSQIKDPASAPALTAALEKETDDGMREHLVRAIASMGEGSPDVVEKLLDSPDHATRALAVRELAGDHQASVWPMPWPRPRPFP